MTDQQTKIKIGFDVQTEDIRKANAQATQNQYFTFRRVSDKSDPAAWWHPGFNARHFVLMVQRWLEAQIRKGF